MPAEQDPPEPVHLLLDHGPLLDHRPNPPGEKRKEKENNIRPPIRDGFKSAPVMLHKWIHTRSTASFAYQVASYQWRRDREAERGLYVRHGEADLSFS